MLADRHTVDPPGMSKIIGISNLSSRGAERRGRLAPETAPPSRSMGALRAAPEPLDITPLQAEVLEELPTRITRRVPGDRRRSPRVRMFCVPAPKLSRAMVLRGLRFPAPAVRIAAPAVRLAPPPVAATPALSLAVRLQVAPPPGAGRTRPWRFRLPRAREVFDRLRAAFRSRLNAHCGTPP